MPAFDRNVRLLALFQISRMALFPVAVLPLYFTAHCGLSVADVMWLQSLFGLVIALAEFPSGYLADRIGYRRTLLWGAWLVAAGWGAYPLASDFWGLLVGEVLLGVGFACVSGCDSALLYESLHAQGQAERFGGLFARQHSFGQLAEGTAALGAGLLYALHPGAPFFVQVAVSLGMVALVTPMREPEREAVARTGSHARQALLAVVSALRSQPRLPPLIALWTVLALASYVPVWLFAPYAREAGVPVAWLGPLWAVGNYVVALGSFAAPRLSRRVGLVGTALCGLSALGVGYAGLSLSHALLGCTFYFAVCWMRGLSLALLSPQEHALFPSQDRAALGSFRSMSFRLSFFVVGPVVGAMVDRYGFHATFAAAGAVLLTGAASLVLPALGAAAQRRDVRPVVAAATTPDA